MANETVITEHQMGQFSLFGPRTSISRAMHLPGIHEETDCGRVPDENLQLECDEVIQNWDTIEGDDGFNALKNDARGPLKSPMYDESQSSDGLHMYEDAPPPNSPILGEGDIKGNLLYANNEYVSHLLNLWRESSEYNASAESTQVNLDEFEHSQRWSLPSEDDFTPSQSSNGSGSGSQDSYDVTMEDRSASPQQNNSSHTDQEYVDSFRNISFAGRENRVHTSRSNSPLNTSSLGSYDLLRSASPRIFRSPSPIYPVNRLLRSPSPNWEELQANLSEITPQDILLFAEERYSIRSRSPASSSDQEVPDIEMDVQSFYSDSDEYTGSRGRTAQSCQDQVVPEFIEE